MPKKNFFGSLGISSLNFFVVLVLLVNTFIWYFTTLIIISDRLESVKLDVLLAWTIYLIAVVGSSLFGAFVSNRQNRLKLVYVWFLLGIIVSLFFSFLAFNTTPEYLLTVTFLSGIAFGLGMPSALAYFADSTVFENRGHVGGITLLITNLGVPFVVLFLGTNLIANSLILAIWRIIGLVTILSLKPMRKIERGKTVSFISIFRNRTFVLYLIPWLMFCLIDRVEQQIFLNTLEKGLIDLSNLAEPFIGTIFALVGGMLSDRIGRKKVIVSGFVALGLAYAILGVAPKAAFSWYFYIIVDGVAWGIFPVIFLLILWGDLSSQTGGREKYYVIGSIPFFIAEFIGYSVKPYVGGILPEAAFPFASLFLFVAVLPLIFSPETLPEKKIQERQIKKYLEEAKKVAEKETGKE